MSPESNLHALALSLLSLAPPWARQEDAPPGPTPASPPAEEGSRVIDPQDGWFDVSRFLEEAHGFLPVIVPITEPALGYGAVGAALFLDPREEAGSEGWNRPNMTAVGGMWTEDGSEGLFAANSTIWSGGKLHTLVGAGDLGLDLELHGIGDDSGIEDDPRRYQLDVLGIFGEARRRLGESDVWLALRLAYGRAEVDFDAAGTVPDVDPEDDDVTLSGPAVSLRYDSLDNFFSPTSGTLSDTIVSIFDDIFGGSRDFQLFEQVLLHHWPLAERWFLGARAQANASFGDTPFYLRPYVNLRGVPSLRYQGEEALSGEVELRWQFHDRFSLGGFGGAGLAWTELEELEREQSAVAGGAGLRYLIARKFGLHMGLDFAVGPEENAIYVQVGNAWVRP